MVQFGTFDWAIVGVYMVVCFWLGMKMKKYASHVDDFVVAGRGVGLYLGIASLAATEFGVVTVMYTAQAGFAKGLSAVFIGLFSGVIMIIMGKTGFVVEKLRATGAATIPEALQKKFGNRVRWWMGLFIATGGILNMGVFLKVTGQFLLAFTGIPQDKQIMGFGVLELSMTTLLLIALIYTTAGGMLSVLVTDLMQFLFMGAGVVVMTFLVFKQYSWGQIVEKTIQVHGEGGVNPWVSDKFGPWYMFYMAMFIFLANCTWQTQITRVLSAKDEKIAGKMYNYAGFYFIGRWALPVMWGAAALLMVNPADFPGGKAILAAPTVMGILTPVGLSGFILAAMLAAEMSTTSGYLLSWATVIVRDLIKPARKEPMTSKGEMFLTRVVTLLIGLFLVVFGLWFDLGDSLWDFLAVTGTIYMSALGSMVIAGLYWKGSNKTGAYASLILGATIPLIGLLYSQAQRKGWVGQLPEIKDFYFGLASVILAAIGMVVGSLIGGSKDSGEAAKHA